MTGTPNPDHQRPETPDMPIQPEPAPSACP